MSYQLDDVKIDDVLDSVDDLEEAHVRTVRDVVQTLGPASFLPLILIVSLIIVTPLSGIPGLSSVCGLTIALVSTQLLFGRDHLWLPDRLLRLRVPQKRLDRVLPKIRKSVLLLDQWTTERLRTFSCGPAARVLLIVCIVCGLAMPFLEVVPATSSMLAGAITLLVVAIISRDGVFALVGLFSLGIALCVLYYLVKSLYGIF